MFVSQKIFVIRDIVFWQLFFLNHVRCFNAIDRIVVTAVIITELREGGNIISAMFTGRKVIHGCPVDEEPSSYD
jgi:hypothetical protein